MVDAAHYVARFREASSGLGRAGTADWPGGPYMSMADAAAVYADLMQGGDGKGAIADGAAPAVDAPPAGEVEREIAATALYERWADWEFGSVRDLILAALSHGEGRK